MTNKVWTIMVKTESSDEYGPFVYRNEPSEEIKKELAKSIDDGSGDGDGPGDYGSWCYLDINEVEIIEN